MPLDSPISYLPTLNSFLIHWENVDEALGEALILPEGDRAAGLALFSELNAAVEAVMEALLDLELVRAEAQEERTEVRRSLERFHAVVRAYWADSPWAGLVRHLPRVGAALDKYLRPCRDGLRLWELLEAGPAPAGATLPIRLGPEGETGRAEYAAAVEALRLQGLAQEAAEFAVGRRRAARNAVMLRVRALLTSYVRVLGARLPVDDALFSVLPRLWPTPGHTPEPVRAAAVWLAERAVARLTWAASKEETLDHYQVRVCTGAKYDREEEVVVADVPAGGPCELETARLLGTPGAAACYRVYVVLKTGNERASNVVAVERP